MDTNDLESRKKDLCCCSTFQQMLVVAFKKPACPDDKQNESQNSTLITQKVPTVLSMPISMIFFAYEIVREG